MIFFSPFSCISVCFRRFVHLLTCYLSSIMTYFIHFSCHSFFYTIERYFTVFLVIIVVISTNVLALPSEMVLQSNEYTFYSTWNFLLFSPKRSVNVFHLRLHFFRVLFFLYIFIAHHFSSPFHFTAHFCIVKIQAILASFFFLGSLFVLFFIFFFSVVFAIIITLMFDHTSSTHHQKKKEEFSSRNTKNCSVFDSFLPLFMMVVVIVPEIVKPTSTW